jgi:hypothetical protein
MFQILQGSVRAGCSMLFIFLVFCVVCFVVIVFVFCLSAFCALLPKVPSNPFDALPVHRQYL